MTYAPERIIAKSLQEEIENNRACTYDVICQKKVLYRANSMLFLVMNRVKCQEIEGKRLETQILC